MTTLGKVHALFSGGKDSITTAHVLSKRGDLAGLVFLDTGIATPDSKAHVEETARRFDWPLAVYRTPASYEDLVLRLGFPSPRTHNLAMNMLKGRAIRAFKRENPGAVLASGVRRKESRRRFINTKSEGTWEGVCVLAPIWDMSTDAVWSYIRRHDLPLAPAYANLHISGDCLCGAFAEHNELLLIRLFYPEVFDRIEALEKRVRASGQKYCLWGGGQASGSARRQSLLCFECEAVPNRRSPPDAALAVSETRGGV
jgi:phosphoadenosine phosphosulfate reductase